MAAETKDTDTALLSLARTLGEGSQNELEWLKRLVNTSPVVTYACRPDGDCSATFVSDGIRALWGYEPEEFLSENGFWASESGFWASRLHPNDAERVFAGLAQLAENSHHSHEYRFRTKSGEYRWVYDELLLLRDSSGTPTEIVGHCFDITQRKAAEAALIESESRLQLIFNNTHDLMALFRVEPGGRFVTETVNRALIDRFKVTAGRDVRAFVGKDFEELLAATGLAPEQIEQRRALYLRAAQERTKVQFQTPATPLRDAAEISIYPVLDQQGTSTHVLWDARTITERRNAEVALRASEERHALVIEATLDGIYDWDLVHHRYYLSPRYKEILGYHDEELSDEPSSFFDRVHPDDQAWLTDAVKLCNEDPTRDAFSNEVRLRHKDGTYRWVVSRGRLIRGADGTPTRVVGAVRDVTKRLQAEEKQAASEKLLRDILDSIHGFVALLTLDGILIEANRAPLEATGLRAEDVFGKFFWNTPAWSHSLEEQERLRSHIAAAARGEVVRYETTVTVRGGRQIIMDATFAPLRDVSGAITNVIGFGVDITARKEAEDELRRAKQLAEAANHAKSEFLANMSHELRTPLNGVIGLTEVVLDSDLNAEQREYLTLVKSSAESLLASLSNILDLSKIQAGQYVLCPKEFRVRDLLEIAVYEITSAAIAKNLQLSVSVSAEVPEVLLGDPDCLRQILSKLLANAVKFTHKGEIAAHLETGELPDILHYTVRDTGIGIPLEKQQIIFEPFSQADGSSRRQFGGSGLGLAICAQLADVVGARLWVESDGRTGSTFHLKVGLKTVPAHPQPLAADESLMVGVIPHPAKRDPLATQSPSDDFADRRQFPRFRTDDPASIEVIRPVAQAPSEVRILDVSKGGLKLQASGAIEPGALVQIHFRDQVVIAEVRHCVDNGAGFHVGVQIRDVLR